MVIQEGQWLQWQCYKGYNGNGYNSLFSESSMFDSNKEPRVHGPFMPTPIINKSGMDNTQPLQQKLLPRDDLEVEVTEVVSCYVPINVQLLMQSNERDFVKMRQRLRQQLCSNHMVSQQDSDWKCARLPVIHPVLPKLGGAGDRFDDYSCVDCANLSCLSGRNCKIHQTYYQNFEVYVLKASQNVSVSASFCV